MSDAKVIIFFIMTSIFVINLNKLVILIKDEGKYRFYIYNEARHSVPGLYLLDKSEFNCCSEHEA